MLDLSVVRKQKNEVIAALKKRGIDAGILVDNALLADEKRRELQSALDQKLALANSLAKEIGELYKRGNPQKANHKKEESIALKRKLKYYKLNSQMRKLPCTSYCVVSQISPTR